MATGNLGSISDATEIDILKFFTGQSLTGTILAGVTTTTAYLGLLTGTVSTDANTATPTETTYTNYLRVALSTSQFGAPSAGSVTNSAGAITFPACGATGATISGWAIFIGGTTSSGSGGKIAMWGNLSDGSGAVTKTLGNGDTFSFATSTFTLSLD